MGLFGPKPIDEHWANRREQNHLKHENLLMRSKLIEARDKAAKRQRRQREEAANAKRQREQRESLAKARAKADRERRAARGAKRGWWFD